MTGEAIHLSVVVPVYGCGPCLDELCRRIVAAVSPITEAFEILLIDDGSPHDDWRAILDLSQRHPRVRGLRLSRNFGQHAAIAAGLSRARGAWSVVMDCDLQDPPEAIPRLYAEAMRTGAEIVFARRALRSASWTRRWLSRGYFRALNLLSDTPVDGRDGALTLVSRKVMIAYLGMGDHDRHHTMVLRWLGFAHASINYDQAPRPSGHSTYSTWALIDSAISGLLFNSTRLLKVIVYMGLICALVGGLLAVALVVRRFTHELAPGWASIIVVQLLVGGGIVVSIGTVGLYVGRVFDQVRRRPMFIIEHDTSAPADGEDSAARG
jgi:polyisoprenyl-phosphate glycosyltransferase